MNASDANAAGLRHLLPMQYDPDKFRAALEAVMERKALSAEAWARRTGIAGNTLRAILDGDKTQAPKIDTLYRLADAAGVELYELLGEDAPFSREFAAVRDELERIRKEHQRAVRRASRLQRMIVHLADLGDDEAGGDEEMPPDA